MSDNPSIADPFGQIADAFVEEYRQGRRPSVEEYARRYPNYAAEIHDILPTLVLMERAKSLRSIDGEGKCDQDYSPLLGKELGDYRIIREVGRGGMGIVYEAEQITLGRRVALKVLAKQALLNSNQRLRFEREAKAAARLHHTNIVPVFGVGEDDGLCYYVMQFIRGLGLDKVLEELKQISRSSHTSHGELRIHRRDDASAAAQRLMSGTHKVDEANTSGSSNSSASREQFSLVEEAQPATSADSKPPPAQGWSAYWHSVAQIGLQVAEALHYAHGQGIMHRDVKPSNLLFDMRGTVWVTDFGLAKSDDHQDLTRSGDILGTIRYLPPEAFAGRHDGRSDIYSLGLTLFELVALRPAFDDIDRAQLVKRVTAGEAPRLDRLQTHAPRDLATIIHKAIEREPAHRYQTAQELADDLHRFCRDEPILARRASLLERARRWSRRNPSLAASVLGIAALVLILVTGAIGTAAYYRQQEEVQRQLHRQANTLAKSNQRLAEENRSALELTRLNYYCAQMSVAHQSWTGHRGILRTKMILDKWRPQPGQPDLRGWEWYYILSLGHRQQQTLSGHQGAVTSVAYAPSGRHIASAARDGTVRIWDVASQQCERTLTGHAGEVHGVAWNATGTQLASAGDDGVLVWNAESGEQVHSIPSQLAIFSVAFSPRGDRLAFGARDGPAEVWDAAHWKRIALFHKHQAHLYDETLSFSPDGEWIAIPASDRLLICRADSGEIRHELMGHDGPIQAGVFSPDGSMVASASRDAAIKVWDVATGKLGQTLVGHTHGVASVAWHPDSSRLASAAWDGTTRVWDVNSGKELFALRSDVRHFFCVAWNPSGDRLVTGGDDNELKIWELAQLQEPAMPLASEKLAQLCIHPKQSKIAAVTAEGQAILLNAGNSASSHRLGDDTGAAASIALSSDGSLAAIGGQDGNVRICDATSGSIQQVLRLKVGPAFAAVWHPDNATLLTISAYGSVELWDAASGCRRPLPPNTPTQVQCAAFSYDGMQIAFGTPTGTGMLVNLKSGRTLTLTGHHRSIYQIAWSPDHEHVATAGDDRTVRLWNAATGDETFTLNGHGEVVTCVQFSPDGQRLLSGDIRGTLKLWHPQTGADMLTLRGLVGNLTSLGWSADGQRIAAVSNGKLLIWDAARGFQAEPPRGKSEQIAE